MIRDVGGSYRRAIVETVHHFGGQRPQPAAIDGLKAEGRWNNDWEASLELLRRQGHAPLPAFAELVATYGEEAAAKYADGLSKRIRNGEFSVDLSRQ